MNRRYGGWSCATKPIRASALGRLPAGDSPNTCTVPVLGASSSTTSRISGSRKTVPAATVKDPYHAGVATLGGGTPPRTVRRGAQLAVVSAVLAAAGAAAAVAAVRHLDTASMIYLNLIAADDRAAAARLLDELHSSLSFHAVVEVAGLVLLAPLGVVLRRQWKAARIFAWIAALVLAAGLGVAVASSPEAHVSPNGSEPPAIRQALENLIASWYPSLTSVLTAAQLAAMAVFSIYLLRSSSDEFYNPPPTEGPAGLWTFARRPD